MYAKDTKGLSQSKGLYIDVVKQEENKKRWDCTWTKGHNQVLWSNVTGSGVMVDVPDDIMIRKPQLYLERSGAKLN